MRTVLFACITIFLMLPAVMAAEPDVLVLDGMDTNFMNDALKRIACPFDHAASLDAAALKRHRVLILCGKSVSADAKAVAAFLQRGGNLLATGAAAQWMLDAKLFDAQSYTPAGTTLHQSNFDGYHRLIFGYPEAKPLGNWITGVPMLLRATEGPLLRLGPNATSVLAAGGPFSLAAFQRQGKGLVLMIGADPQGGNEYLSLTKGTPKLGDELHTDMLLANAIAWLRDPACNLIPNSGFETNADQASEKSHWEIGLNKGAKSEWVIKDAPEGRVYLRMTTPAGGSATVTPFIPIAVERAAKYRFACRYKATAGASFMARHLARSDDNIAKLEQYNVALPASESWTRFETQLDLPDDCHYLKLNLLINKPGELCVDEITLKAVP
jgi:hypothetical protein